jgi:hypothetical protein
MLPSQRPSPQEVAGGMGEADHVGHDSLSPHFLPLYPEKFTQHMVSYEDLTKNPGLLDDPNLVVKINEK